MLVLLHAMVILNFSTQKYYKTGMNEEFGNETNLPEILMQAVPDYQEETNDHRYNNLE